MLDCLAGFATVETATMRAGTATIKVERYRITDDGRAALAPCGGPWVPIPVEAPRVL
jgi:hypothetical protein